MRTVLLTSLLLALSASGCDRPRLTSPLLPTSSTPIPQTALPTPVRPIPRGYWVLTATLTDVTGRHVCPHWAPEIGHSAEYALDVRRSDSVVTLVYDVRDRIDYLELAGTVSGESFEARTTHAGFLPCGGSRLDYEFESLVSGRFSSDGAQITARETWSYRVPSGDAFVYYFDWIARAPNALP